MSWCLAEFVLQNCLSWSYVQLGPRLSVHTLLKEDMHDVHDIHARRATDTKSAVSRAISYAWGRGCPFRAHC